MVNLAAAWNRSMIYRPAMPVFESAQPNIIAVALGVGYRRVSIAHAKQGIMGKKCGSWFSIARGLLRAQGPVLNKVEHTPAMRGLRLDLPR